MRLHKRGGYERFVDSLHHYYVYSSHGFRWPYAIWRAFAYECLGWPDGLSPKKHAERLALLRARLAQDAKWDQTYQRPLLDFDDAPQYELRHMIPYEEDDDNSW